MSALGRVLRVDGLGRVFFATVTLGRPVIASRDAAMALALIETVLDPVVALEARRTACALVVQARHAGGALSQLLLHEGPDSTAVELDGTGGSLRLADDITLLLRPGVAATIPLPVGEARATEASVARLAALLDRATQANIA